MRTLLVLVLVLTHCLQVPASEPSSNEGGGAMPPANASRQEQEGHYRRNLPQAPLPRHPSVPEAPAPRALKTPVAPMPFLSADRIRTLKVTEDGARELLGVGCSPHGILLYFDAGTDTGVGILDPQTGKIRLEPDASGRIVATSADGSLRATAMKDKNGERGFIRDLVTGKEKEVVEVGLWHLTQARRISRDGSVFFGPKEDEYRISDLGRFDSTRFLLSAYGKRAAISADFSTVALVKHHFQSDPYEVSVLATTGKYGQEIARLPLPARFTEADSTGAEINLALSEDGRYLMVVSPRAAGLFDLKEKRELPIPAPDALASAASSSGSTLHLCLGGRYVVHTLDAKAGTIAIWDMQQISDRTGSPWFLPLAPSPRSVPVAKAAPAPAPVQKAAEPRKEDVYGVKARAYFAKIGLKVTTDTDVRGSNHGVRIIDVEADSWASQAGLKNGDLITALQIYELRDDGFVTDTVETFGFHLELAGSGKKKPKEIGFEMKRADTKFYLRAPYIHIPLVQK